MLRMERTMNRVFRLVSFAGAALLMIITSLALSHRERVMQLTRAWQERSDGSELANTLQEPRDVLAYIAVHPEQVALCGWTLGAEHEGIFVNADARRPIAGLSRLLLLTEYARRVTAGEWNADERVTLAAWERHWRGCAARARSAVAQPFAGRVAPSDARFSRAALRA
jgi:hypothetical protein